MGKFNTLGPNKASHPRVVVGESAEWANGGTRPCPVVYQGNGEGPQPMVLAEVANGKSSEYTPPDSVWGWSHNLTLTGDWWYHSRHRRDTINITIVRHRGAQN